MGERRSGIGEERGGRPGDRPAKLGWGAGRESGVGGRGDGGEAEEEGEGGGPGGEEAGGEGGGGGFVVGAEEGEEGGFVGGAGEDGEKVDGVEVAVEVQGGGGVEDVGGAAGHAGA